MVYIGAAHCVTFTAIPTPSHRQEHKVKTLLVMLLIGICAIGLQSPEIMKAIGMAGAAQDPAASVSAIAAPQAAQKPMTAQEFAELSKTDPQAYQKYVNSFQAAAPERSEVDKLMNFLARGKFE